jgi:hypothetical protein
MQASSASAAQYVCALLWMGACALSGLVLSPGHASAQQGRPVYVFAHRVNDVPPNNNNDIQSAVDHGANAVEFDLQVCNGTPGEWRVHHDNCNGIGSRSLAQWLTAFVNTRNRGNIRAIQFDIKAPLSSATPARMQMLVSQARAMIPRDVLVIYSVGVWASRWMLLEIAQSLRANESVTVDYMSTSDGTAQDVINFFKARSIVNLAYADGVTAVSTTPASVFRNLDIATRNRDTVRDVKLVYSWTYERENSIKEMLVDRRLDGLLVNDCAIHVCADPFGNDGLTNAIDVDNDNDSIRRANANDLGRWGLHALQPAVLSAINL